MDVRQNVENMHDWIGNFSFEVKTIRKNQIEMLGGKTSKTVREDECL